MKITKILKNYQFMGVADNKHLPQVRLNTWKINILMQYKKEEILIILIWAKKK